MSVAIRPTLTVGRGARLAPRLAAMRLFAASACSLQKSPSAKHPALHESANVTAGQPVSDHAKQDESKITGLPKEPSGSKVLAMRDAPSLFSLADRTIIITGGGRGIGLTCAHAILESGAHVAAVDLLPEPSEPFWTEAKDLATQKGLSLTYHRLDVTRKDDVEQTVSSIFEDARPRGPVRGLLTAAGIQMLKSATEYTPEEFRKIIDVNVTGTFLVAGAFAREWEKQRGKGPLPDVAEEGSASVVMIGSMSGHVANYGLECAAYNASKAAVNQLGKNLAMEWGKKGIRVNSLSPGYIRTAMTAALLEEKPELQEIWMRGSLLGRLSTPDEFRGPTIFLLSDASSFMTGADILVDGGHTAT